MTLQQFISRLELIASKQPAINMIVRNDIFRLNAKADARYGVFAWTQAQHSARVEEGIINYTFNLFYVDRLKNDKSNQIEVQSVGIQALDNIIRTLNEQGMWVESSYQFTPFNQRFLDECAGVFCNVTFSIPVGGICSEQYADFNDDFNDDFLIF